MEPCAPGTEDDVPLFTTKRDLEIERLLSQKAVLRNGRYRNVFERTVIKGSEHWYCNACECPVMGRIYNHETGKRHTYNIVANGGGPERREDEKREEDVTIEIAPGEPAPPGFEEEAVIQATLIQSTLDGFKSGPLLALEYLIELHDSDRSKEPFYLCVLCDKKGDPRTVLTHLTSYNHISFFLRRHFPKCWRKLVPYMTKTNKKEWQNVMQRVAEAIEKQFGRLKPTAVEKSKFDNEKDRAEILEKIIKSKHFTEQGGYTFEEYIVVEKLTTEVTDDKPPPKKSPSPPRVLAPNQRLKESGNKIAPTKPKVISQEATASRERKDSLSSVSSISSDVGQPERLRKPDSKRPLSPVRATGRYQRFPSDETRKFEPRHRRPINRSPPGRFERKLPYERRGSPSPKRRPSPKKQDNSEGESDKLMEKRREELRKIQEFRKLSRAIENDLQKNLQKYEKNPEKHPQYNEEWKKFWNKRYKELQAQGVDVSNYDFKPEWIIYWNRRMVELHSDEVREKKEALRKRLALPDEIKPIMFKINAPAVGGAKIGPNLPVTALADQENDVIVIDDENDAKERATSPWEQDKPWNKERPTSPWKRERRKSPSRSSPARKANVRSPPRKMAARSPLRRGSPRRSPVRRNSPRRRSPTRAYDRPKSRSPTRPYDRPKSRSPKRSYDRPKSRSPTRPYDHPKARSPTRAYDHPKSRSPTRPYDHPRSRNRSLSRNRSRSPSRNHPHPRNLSKERSSYGRSRSRSRNRRSKSLDRYSDRRALGRESPFERDMVPKEKLSERRILVRESSFERDLKGKERIRTVADLPWEREKAFRVAYDPFFDPPMMPRKPMILPEPVMPEEEPDNGEVNVVDVLRILTALEDKLGLLGSKVIDLLAQALAMEKKEANSSESLLDNEINCVLFETVKEKLKGQLQAGLVDIVQERAFKKAIKKIASLIHLASSRKTEKPKIPFKANPLSVPGVGAVDKAAIAKQITSALIAQGKTDVTEGELEQLINAVVGMAEATKNSAKPVTTASFLQQLSGSDKSADTKKTEVMDIEKFTEPLTPSPRKNSPNMDNLSDSDLQTLLQNFKDLSTDEQHNLINYLKKLELREPERVEKLRQFVNLEPGKFAIEGHSEEHKNKSTRASPFMDRLGSVNPAPEDLIRIESEEEEQDENDTNDKSEIRSEQQKQQKIHVDSEDDDYTFEDVVKTVSKNVKDKELQSNMKIVEQSMKIDSLKSKAEVDLTNAKDLISSLMSNITKSNADSSRIDLKGLAQSSAPSTSTSSIITSADFAKTLSNINVLNLTSIVNSVKDFGSSKPNPEVIKPTSNKIDTNPNAGKLNFDLNQLNKPSESLYDRFSIDPDYIDEPNPDRRHSGFGYDNAPVGSGGMPNRGAPVYGGDQAYRGDQYSDQGYGGAQRYAGDQGYGYKDNQPEMVAYPSYPRDSAPSYNHGNRNDYYPERSSGYGDRGMAYGNDGYRPDGYGLERDFDSRYVETGSHQQMRSEFSDRGSVPGQFSRPVGNSGPNNYYQRGQADQRNNPRFNNIFDRWC